MEALEIALDFRVGCISSLHDWRQRPFSLCLPKMSYTKGGGHLNPPDQFHSPMPSTLQRSSRVPKGRLVGCINAIYAEKFLG